MEGTMRNVFEMFCTVTSWKYVCGTGEDHEVSRQVEAPAVIEVGDSLIRDSNNRPGLEVKL
jgi:hypothetical protein